jgi:signal transduction histidine kinase
MALIVLISFVLLGGISTAWSYRLSTSEKKATMSSTLQQTARYVTIQYIDYSTDLSDLRLSLWLAMISEVTGFELLITNTDGLVGSCSDRDFRHLGKIVPESSLSLVAAGGSSVSLSTLGQIYPERRQVAGAPLTIRINGELYIFGYLFVSSDSEVFKQTWRQFSGMYTPVALSVMALTFVISYVATKKQAEPLNEMAVAAHRFARGDFSSRVEDSGRLDEIGQLTQAFNAMADSLESSEMLRREFVANISHELKTPMTVIAGFADGILDGTIPPENETRYLGVISSETRRLSRLVSSMLYMSKLQSADAGAILRNSFDISEVVRIALLSLDSKIEQKQLDVIAELPEEAIITRGDKDSITQVVYNLIDNAIKFSTPGGVISLDLWKQGDQAYISFENHGETIPEEELPHIFDRFHKTDKSRSADRDGVGLGLYIVKTILDKHNQDVFVTSANGATKFVFTLSMN